MRVVAIVQARMTSTRLPGKVLADLEGRPMLARVVDRVGRARSIDSVWVACTDRSADDPIAAWAQDAKIPAFRGSETDVLGRFVGAAREAAADVVVRVTADCPLIDPRVVDLVAGGLLTALPECDYAANVLHRSYPRGLDVEAFTRQALDRMDLVGRSAAAREHVTIPARLEHRSLFRVRSIEAPTNDSDLRWTVDTGPDLAFARLAYRELGLADRVASYLELVRWCRADERRCPSDDAGETWDPSRPIGATGRTEER